MYLTLVGNLFSGWYCCSRPLSNRFATGLMLNRINIKNPLRNTVAAVLRRHVQSNKQNPIKSKTRLIGKGSNNPDASFLKKNGMGEVLLRERDFMRYRLKESNT